MRTLGIPVVIILLVVPLVACSSADPRTLTDEGTAALNSGDARGAVQKLDAALARMDESHADHLRASLVRCQALARVDPALAEQDFLALARARADRVREQDFAVMASELVGRGALAQATAVAEAGMRMFPESPGMQSVRDLVGDAAKKAKDPAAMKTLKGLGYAGDG